MENEENSEISNSEFRIQNSRSGVAGSPFFSLCVLPFRFFLFFLLPSAYFPQTARSAFLRTSYFFRLRRVFFLLFNQFPSVGSDHWAPLLSGAISVLILYNRGESRQTVYDVITETDDYYRFV